MKLLKINRRTIVLLVLGLIFVVFCVWFFGLRSTGVSGTEPLYKVTEGPLDITVTATGTIQSKHYEIVRSGAKGRNTIIWIVDEGKNVTNGQAIVELDASEFERNRADQLIVVGNANAILEQSREKLAIAEIERDSAISDAELKLKLAKLDLEKYEDGEYPQALQEASGKIALAEEELGRAEENLNWTKKLADEGFVTRSDLQSDELAVRQKKLSLDSAVTAMNLLTNYTVKQQSAKLKSAVEQAERDLDRQTRQSRASIAQAQSDLTARELEATRQNNKLESIEKQIESCHIISPTNGIAIYASTMQASRRHWGADVLAAGSTVVERQELIYIPVEGGKVVEFSVTESDLKKLADGQRAQIKIAAMPDTILNGTLTKIGLLPDGRSAWLNPDLNVYNCVITMDATNNDEIRAGMNCEVSMLIESYPKVVAVPLQCVLRVAGETTVFRYESGVPVPCPVKLGLDNGRLVHVISGIEPGDEIMLSPPLDKAEMSTEPQIDTHKMPEKNNAK